MRYWLYGMSWIYIMMTDSVLFIKRKDSNCVFLYFVGMNKDIDEVRSWILGKMPLSTLSRTFSKIRSEEAWEGNVMGKIPQSSLGASTKVRSRTNLGVIRANTSNMCKTCWKLNGKPLKWKKKSHTFQAINYDQ